MVQSKFKDSELWLEIFGRFQTRGASHGEHKRGCNLKNTTRLRGIQAPDAWLGGSVAAVSFLKSIFVT